MSENDFIRDIVRQINGTFAEKKIQEQIKTPISWNNLFSHLLIPHERVPNKNKNLSDVLQWTPVQKCKCVTACDIQHYISYAEKLSFRGKFKNVMGQGTKASIRNCPIGEKRTRKSLLCKNGNWVNSKNVSEINPKICVGRN